MEGRQTVHAENHLGLLRASLLTFLKSTTIFADLGDKFSGGGEVLPDFFYF